jgi:hypothetical protein
MRGQGRDRRLTATLLGAAVACLMLVPAIALAHIERPSYWPDPKPEKVEGIEVGGDFPKAKSLGSALDETGKSELHVVCQGKNGSKSLDALADSIKSAKKGWRLRPSLPEKQLSNDKANKLTKLNKKFAKECSFDSVQAAVDAADNHDRIVIMPGRYTEPQSRKAPVNDPKCNPSMIQLDSAGEPAPSYRYQASCPNDQNLIHVLGRKPKGEPVIPPDPDRHGIPKQELGKCIRCGLQMEGSGVRPEDVIMDGGSNYDDPGDPYARPGGEDRPVEECHVDDGEDNPCFVKHVVLRTDRSDGFVGRNFLLRGAKEHTFYTEETDGMLLEKVKFFWGADYGHLSYTTDHHMLRSCEGIGAGDAAVYPGASPQTGEYRKESFYPKQRFNSVVKKCDLHASLMGYSGSMGNSVRVTQNRFYGNVNGLTSDTLSPQGHPGYPADGMQVDNNWFFSNNLDIYREDPPFDPLIPEPIGTGMIYFGYNDATVTENWFFDNWRRGTMLQATPDALIREFRGEPEGNLDEQIHCPTPSDEEPISTTSCDNKYTANHMGQVPEGFAPFPELTMFENQTSFSGGEVPNRAPNGVDFWWDEWSGNTGNCWYDNQGPDGTRGSLTGDPPLGPEGQSMPGFLPEDCISSLGRGAPYKTSEVLECFIQFDEGTDVPTCDWFETPARPGTAAAREERSADREARREFEQSPEAAQLEDLFAQVDGLTPDDLD